MTSTPLPVTLFADFTSPFCFVTEAALDRLSGTHSIAVRTRAFELYPSPSALPAPAHDPGDLAQAAGLAAETGIDLHAPSFLPRTRKAHEAALFAAERGYGTAMRRALYRAYWEEERDIGRIDVLMELAGAAGMDATDLKIALDIDRHRDEVVADEALARRLRVASVPTLYLGTGAGARIVQGALTLAALDEAVASS